MKFPARVSKGAVKVITIRAFEEEQNIADEVISGCVVLADFKFIDTNIKQRILSFLEGTMFGIDGKMLTLRDDLVLLLPNGALAEEKSQMDLFQQKGPAASAGAY